jgi:hypothetical protein
MRDLIDKVGKSNERQCVGSKKVMRPGRKQLRESVPDKEHSDICEGNDPENDRQSSAASVETAEHKPLLPVP